MESLCLPWCTLQGFIQTLYVRSNQTICIHIIVSNVPHVSSGVPFQGCSLWDPLEDSTRLGRTAVALSTRAGSTSRPASIGESQCATYLHGLRRPELMHL